MAYKLAIEKTFPTAGFVFVSATRLTVSGDAMKVLTALAVALIAPALIASADADVSGKKPGKIVVNCPDLSCCPPQTPGGDICIYVGPMTCTDKSGHHIPC